jgi:hypothetical protein
MWSTLHSLELGRTKIPEPPIHFSGATNFFGPKNEFTSHQFETSVLEPPMSFSPLSNHQTVVKPRASRLNFYEGPILVSEFENCAERGKLGVESSQSRASAGSTCLSVAKVPPDYAAHIPPILGGHPVTASAAKPFFLRGKQASVRGRADTHHETTTQKRKLPRTKPSVAQLQSGVY